MDIIGPVLKYIVLGFLGLIGLLIVLAVLFGKRVVKQWEYEAEFRDDKNREFGEFDIELSHFAKTETEDTFKASFKLRHESLAIGQLVQVFLDEVLVIEGNVATAGRIFLSSEHIKNDLTDAREGQACRVVIAGVEQFKQQIIRD